MFVSECAWVRARARVCIGCVFAGAAHRRVFASACRRWKNIDLSSKEQRQRIAKALRRHNWNTNNFRNYSHISDIDGNDGAGVGARARIPRLCGESGGGGGCALRSGAATTSERYVRYRFWAATRSAQAPTHQTHTLWSCARLQANAGAGAMRRPPPVSMLTQSEATASRCRMEFQHFLLQPNREM